MSNIDIRLHKKAADDIQLNYKKIEVTPGEGLFNYRCYYNARQWQYENGGDIIEVVAINCDEPILHYVNKKKGVYIDNTLGYTTKDWDYYYLRTIPACLYHDMQKVFTDKLKHLDNRYLKWYHKFFFSIERIF